MNSYTELDEAHVFKGEENSLRMKQIYTNTDQQETTRLGDTWEWSTIIHVLREGGQSMNPPTELDEAHLFKGEENSLRMQQIYTKEFQCVFKLSKYPFDTQVSASFVSHI